MRLPPLWRREVGDTGVRALRRALYGLRVAPRKWWTLYKQWLVENLWIRCDATEGLYKKPSAVKIGSWLKLSVYVGIRRLDLEDYVVVRAHVDFAGQVWWDMITQGGRRHRSLVWQDATDT